MIIQVDVMFNHLHTQPWLVHKVYVQSKITFTLGLFRSFTVIFQKLFECLSNFASEGFIILLQFNNSSMAAWVLFNTQPFIPCFLPVFCGTFWAVPQLTE